MTPQNLLSLEDIFVGIDSADFKDIGGYCDIVCFENVARACMNGFLVEHRRYTIQFGIKLLNIMRSRNLSIFTYLTK